MQLTFCQNVSHAIRQQLDSIAHGYADFRKKSNKAIVSEGVGSLTHQGTSYAPYYLITYAKAKTTTGKLVVVFGNNGTPVLFPKGVNAPA